MENYKKLYQRWQNHERIELTDDEIKEKFGSYLEFGTAGLRGKMTAGTNAMNVYTVRHATQGFADYIFNNGGRERGVAIAYDSRRNSKLFATKAAAVMTANGIKVFLFDDICPTPMLSFAVREFGCIAGINITASHNPKEYNGYKAYWEDGAQLSLEQVDAVSEYIRNTDIFDGVKTNINDSLVTMIDSSFDEKYLAQVKAQSVTQIESDLKVVYTPLHGTGGRVIPKLLNNIIVVPEQMIPDGEFPTAAFPNPEYIDVYAPGIRLAESINGEIIIANDPDADRMGAMIRNHDGGFMLLTGNQTGALLLDYIITALDKLPPEPYAIKTIVTSEIITKICELNGVKLHNVLTGFKFIAEVIKKESGNFLLGFEESYGYMRGTYVRDKDGIVAAMLFCEMAAYYKSRGMTMANALDALYEKYGRYIEETENLYYEDIDGVTKMKAIMDRLRLNPPKSLGGEDVVVIRDYLSGEVMDLRTGLVTSTELASSNVLYYQTAENNVVVIRPSGTEPKIKIYYLLHEPAEVERFKAEMEKAISC
ncbi:MAG: phospho-sugar mutase [Oscillospiraceae bacterium]|nr:phospho-sugar mutase [Oscillospiraceae bacterium]